MKKVGIIGGLGPASTLDYYRDIILSYRQLTGLDEYPELVIDSVNMTKLLKLVGECRYDELVEMLLASINNLKNAGAEFAVIASNTPHIVFKELKGVSPLPLISIVEETCKSAKNQGYKRVLVLGTKFIMQNGLYTDELKKYDIEGIVPDKEGIEKVHSFIFPKLEEGIVDLDDKKKMIRLIDDIIEKQGIQAVILGCTELPLMIKQEDLNTKLLNTTEIHIKATADYILK